MATIQDFEVSRGNDETLGVLIETDIVGETLSGSTVEWSVYVCSYGVPLPSPVLIHKTTADDSILIPGSPDLFFNIYLTAADTDALELGYYYHEATVTDGGGKVSTVMTGIMAVTMTMGSA